MNRLSVTGLSHKKTGIDLREKLNITREDYPRVLHHFEQDRAVKETVVLSTCNRVEIYCVGAGDEPVEEERIVNFLADHHKVARKELVEHVYHYRDAVAVTHLFKVASGIDSMVLGETQILAQIKDAFTCALEGESTGKYLNSLFQRAFNVAKCVHTGTAISQTKVSVPSVAVDFAADLFSSFVGKTLLQIGSGETGELALTHFTERGIDDILLTNRTLQRAQDTAAKFGAQVFPYEDLGRNLHKADIVVAALDAQAHVVTAEMMQAAIRTRRNRPVFLLDLSVPRAISPAVALLDNVFLYDIDDLQTVVERNMELREAEVVRCLEIIENEVRAFLSQAEEWKTEPLIKELTGHLEAIRSDEWRRMEGKLGKLDETLRREIEHMTHRMVKKILHSPLTAIRADVKDGQGLGIVEAARKLFFSAKGRGRPSFPEGSPRS